MYVYTCLKPIHLKKPQVEYNCHAEYTARRPTPPAPTSPSESPRGCSEGEGRETLSRALPRGLVPLDSHLLGVGVGTGACALPPYLAGTPRSDDRPPTHFFVKKKFIPVCGAAPATQKVSSVRCAESLGGTGGIPYAGGSFFLYEKSVLRESDSLRGRREEVSTDLTPTLSAPKKALKKDGNPRGARPPWQELEGRALEVFPFGHAEPPTGAQRERRYSSMAWAAVFPAPMARITVAAPVTASPPA